MCQTNEIKVVRFCHVDFTPQMFNKYIYPKSGVLVNYWFALLT